MKKLQLEDIKQYIAIREPVLLLNEVEFDGLDAIKGYKQLESEDFFRGHLKDYPLMPGCQIVEALTQLFSVGLNLAYEEAETPRLVGIDNVRFYKEVHPGDKLVMYVECQSVKRGIAIGAGEAYVGNDCVCKATLKHMIPNKTAVYAKNKM